MKPTELNLGPDVICHLLPHRRPFLMVDRVVAYTPGDRPTLTASKYISANEPVFEGHFPGLALWPGAYTVEGMGQTGNLLQVLHNLLLGVKKAGKDPAEVLVALRNMELGATFSPGYRPLTSAWMLELLASPDFPSRTGLIAAVNVKLLAPVFAGQRLDYQVTLTHVVDGSHRWEVEANVDGQLAAKGTLTSTSNLPVPMRR